MIREEIKSLVESLIEKTHLSDMNQDELIEHLNYIRECVHEISPFRHEPVDFVKWVKCEEIKANDYNPNTVAPPEMELLKTSILHDGYTQPIVSWCIEDGYEVIDGFHRNRVGKESQEIRDKINGYLPISIVRSEQTDRNDRIASTIRHNRARGKHKVDSMSDIVIELKNRNWTNERIARELGMDQDEILRLCQITGLADLFSDDDFSRAWDIEGEINEADFTELSDNVDDYGDEKEEFRAVNTSDESRIFHTYEKWECYRSGFYSTTKDGMSKQQCEQAYCEFLSNDSKFREGLQGVISSWKNSCEHYLTNTAMNRIAWLGQAAACYSIGIPSVFRSGYHLLSDNEQERADQTALEYLNSWLISSGREAISMDDARSNGRQSDIY